MLLQHNVQNWQDRLVEMLRDALLDRAREQLGDGAVARYAAEVAEHKRDPYSLVEEIVERDWKNNGGEPKWGRTFPFVSTSGTPASTSNLGESLMFSIDHIGVAVKSLSAAKGIYEKLGLELCSRGNCGS